MSLRGFHILFISIAALICFGFCGWAFVGAVEALRSPLLHVCGAASGVVGFLLIAYGIWFVRKSKIQAEPAG